MTSESFVQNISLNCHKKYKIYRNIEANSLTNINDFFLSGNQSTFGTEGSLGIALGKVLKRIALQNNIFIILVDNQTRERQCDGFSYR